MLRILINLMRSVLYLAMGCLVGYYSFESGGLISILTNVFFFVLGILMVEIWQNKLSANSSLNERNLDANL